MEACLDLLAILGETCLDLLAIFGVKQRPSVYVWHQVGSGATVSVYDKSAPRDKGAATIVARGHTGVSKRIQQRLCCERCLVVM